MRRKAMVVVAVGCALPVGSALAAECEQACLIGAIDGFHACRDEGGSPAECLSAARDTFDTCVAGCEVSCEEQCILDGQALFEACLAEPGNPIECFQDGSEFLLGCLEGCGGDGLLGEDDPREGEVSSSSAGSCLFECGSEAVGVFQGCLEGGGGFEECFIQAQESYDACLLDCEPSCEEQCLLDGGQALEDCLDEGGPPGLCIVEARQMTTECMEACSG